MSHSKLREEKNCLNCGHLVEDRFCTQCGQENIQIADSAFHLIIHYIQDLFHYDGKLWHTVKSLFLKPGLVPVEYMEGKRKSQLEPVRFYVFSSTVFFVLLFYALNTEDMQIRTEPKFNYHKRLFYLEQEKEFIVGSADTMHTNALIQSIRYTQDSVAADGGDTTQPSGIIDLYSVSDSISQDSGWLIELFNKRAEEHKKELKTKHDGDQYKAMSEYLDELVHKIPQLLFISMPFFALFLKLLYFSSRRKNYVEHFIFSIYQYSYLFMILIIWMLIQFVVNKIANPALYTVFSVLVTVIVIYLFIYLLLSIKRFYQDRWRYLLPRYFILLFMVSILMIVLFIMYLFITYLF